MVQNQDVILSLTGQIRTDLKNEVQPEKEVVEQLIAEIKKLEGTCSSELIQAFAEETKSFLLDGNAPNYSKTREYTNVAQTEISFVAGLFHSPYNPRFGFECIFYKKHDVNNVVTKHYPSSVVLPVTVLGCTEGFKETMNVSLFPEFFVADAPIDDKNKVFYFTNRFEQRNQLLTKPVLERITTPGSLQFIKSASNEEIQEACIAWVYLHEYHHRTGVLPIPNFLSLKGSRSAASLEELRVDLHSILACMDLYFKKDFEKGLLFAEVIFIERLLRYPIQIDPNQNFDSRASQLFHTFLSDLGIEVFDGELINIDIVEARETLQKMVSFIDMFERQIARLTPAEAKTQIEHLCRSLGGYNAETKEYERMPMYKKMIEVCQNNNIPVVMAH
ncbi:DUF6421 family protein [Ectobacillus funiculus]|uniref:DUF6421 family protein n=1 Tax=Ectobacillus funiculus TaxID=137993 RepID=A0ABV5WIL2_9BACI